jgi:6-phosphofructokinase 2
MRHCPDPITGVRVLMLPVVTLTINPAVDISAAVPRVVPVDKLRCHDSRRDPGGGGINVARVVHRLGAEVLAVYPAGGCSGGALIGLLQKEGLKSWVIDIARETREDVTIFDESSREQYRFVLPGPTLSETEWRQCLTAVAAAHDGPGIACASGSLPPGVPEDFYARFAQACAMTGQKAVLDAPGGALKPALAVPLYLIKPNLQELRELTGAPLDSNSARLEACRALMAKSAVEMIALSLGAQGALLVTRRDAFQASCASPAPVSAVGAGDSFLGGMIWAFASKKEPREALRYAVAAGSAAVMAQGTALCGAEEVHRKVANVLVSDLAEKAL